MPEIINLVDTSGKRVDMIEKIEAHEKGLLHEAFSIFIFNSKNEILLQKRAIEKYHSGGLWTNTCCSHTRVDESLDDAIHRRLIEEMGFDTDMRKVYAFIYKVDLDHGLTEHEYDYVYVGNVADDILIQPNPEEVCDYKWINFDDLKKDVINNPDGYTEWMKMIVENDNFSNILKKTPSVAC